jgi:hypothetical protein
LIRRSSHVTLRIAVMWTADTDIMEDGVRRVALTQEGWPVTYADALALWQNDVPFRAYFIRLLARAPFDAVLWETPPVTRATVQRGFEFVLVNCPALAALAPNARAFAPHFDGAPPDAGVVTFANLGGDAVLVAPTPRGELAAYPHLTAFARQAPADQQHAFWQAVGGAVTARLSDRPLWLSTSGLGVAWLHARLDSRPKYYSYRPYRAAAA